MTRLIPLLAAFFIGCGLPDDTLMSDLEEGDVEKLCEELASDERSVTCTTDDYEFTIEIGGSADECVTDNDASYYEGCDVTVGDIRDCDDAWSDLSDEEICGLESGFPAECDPLIECAFGG